MGITELTKYIVKNSYLSYKNSFRMSIFGYFWAIFQPAAMIALYSVVFGHFMKTKIDLPDGQGYAVFVSVALLPWMVFSVALQNGATAILENAAYIKKIAVPIYVYPAKAALEQLYGLAAIVAVLFVFLSFYGGVKLSWLLCVPIMFLLGMAAIGISMILSVVTVFLRDMQKALAFFMQLLMWALPIVYPLSIIPENMRWIVEYNPLFYYFDSLRSLLLYQNFISVWHIVIMTVFSVLVFAFGLWMCVRAEDKIRDIV